MITQDNLKDFLKLKDFKKKGGKYVKEYEDLPGVYMQVDLEKEELIYPKDKGLKVNGEFTTNFSAKENFVVFECVDRLLGKGYKPEHIELEPRWQLGHGASGGRADIMVKDNTGRSFLIIECKIPGNEFKKEWDNTLSGKGQLFSYARQTGSTQYICLYTSYIKGNQIDYDSYIIALKDNEKYLKELADEKALTFERAKLLEAGDLYETWKKTYNCAYATIGIFEDEIDAYIIGKLKYTEKDLKEISDRDIQGKYHQFATILRQHNISGHENAFDKLVNLFLCKVVDESKNSDDLKFYWKTIVYDNYFDLQDRLQKLYQAGMKEFLGEEVTYIDNAQIDDAFRFFSNDPDATKETIKKYFRQLKFFTNSDFAFIEVHNEKLFYQNAIVLLKMVEMLQNIRLQTNNDNQFLGDLFEGFLDKGIKQSEGQYFTPMPIVKFILYSLPLEKIYHEAELPPQVIDYACGAGHFLTELAKQIKPILEKKNQNVNLSDYYKAITGIEKEYRLSKVSKVSAFMYQQNEIKIIYADALSRKSGVKDGEYSILVTNPPYSVKGFLETLDEKEREAFELTAVVDSKTLATNNGIETFFIERAKQLLKPGGIAGIVLPSSILSNDKAIYTTAREILIKYFYIRAIVEFGSQTFGKTGTNTVVLFLQRREENPAAADHWKNRVNDWFFHRDEAKEKTYADLSNLQEYCEYIGVSHEDYRTFMNGKPTQNLLASEIFVQYKEVFDRSTEVKNIKSKKFFKEKTPEEQNKLLFDRFIQNTIEIEKDKIYYYLLVKGQKTLIIKGPSGNAEQKKFLGYEWSNAKGNEGIKYLSSVSVHLGEGKEEEKELLEKLSGLQNINTPLYDPQDRDNKDKINFLIAQHFEGKSFKIPDNLSAYVSYYNLVDLLDFTRKNFNKAINLTPQKQSQHIHTKWPLVKLGDVTEIVAGQSPESKYYNEDANGLPFYQGKKDFGRLYLNEPVYWTTQITKESYKNDILMSVRAPVGDVNINPFDKICIGRGLAAIRTDNNLLQRYLFEFVSQNKSLFQGGLGTTFDSISTENLRLKRVPLPPIEIQQQIVDECEKIEQQIILLQDELDNVEKQVVSFFAPLFKLDKKIKLASLAILLKRGRSTKYGKTNVQVIKSGQARGYEEFDFTNKFYAQSESILDERTLQKGDLLINSTGVGTAGRVTLFNLDGIYVADSHITILRPNVEIAYPKYILYCLAFIGFKNIEKLAKGSSGQIELTLSTIENIQIPLLELDKQLDLIREIELLEKRAKEAKEIIKNVSAQKRAILEKYL